ncbi:hypothetical protein IMW82_13405 [Rhodanobacter sp. B2A1Ga4]|nr:hypothetical protein [Rhodanobacter sp. B2A1Ga4]
MSQPIEPRRVPERWSMIEQAIHARAEWAFAHIASLISRASVGYERARVLAERAGNDNQDAPCPTLLADIAELAESFDAGQAHTRDADRVESALLASDWQALGLPTPTALLAQLLASGSYSIDGTLLTWERDLEVTWYTNAYGIDGALCGRPDLAVLQRFLTDTARGIEYGPVPH